MTRKDLPLGQKTFAEIIDESLLYADKTRYIFELVESSARNYFLSRPRHFGKTLLVSTLEELFTGNRERFKGLWIDQSDYAFPRRPVISLSLELRAETPQIFEANLLASLKKIAQNAGLGDKVQSESPSWYFSGLVTALSEEANSKIAVLIDDVDTPITANLTNLKVAEANARKLRNLLATLKDPDVLPCVAFTLITGATRFPLHFGDSGANHLNDITLDTRYAGLSGFTREEFEFLFADRLDATLARLQESGQMDSGTTLEDLRAKIFDWYGGYNWKGETKVLNPFSILKFFQNQKFDNYWVQSSWPAPLSSRIKEKPLDYLAPWLKSWSVVDMVLTEIERLGAELFLFNNGFLTLDKINWGVDNSGKSQVRFEKSHSLKFPNWEVEKSYFRHCFNLIFGPDLTANLDRWPEELTQAFLSQDTQKVSSIFREFLAAIPIQLRSAAENSGLALIKPFLLALGLRARSESLESLESRRKITLCLEPPGQVVVVLGLRYQPKPPKIRDDSENKILGNLALLLLPKAIWSESLAALALRNFPPDKIKKILSELVDQESSEAKKNELLARAALDSFPASATNEALASLAIEKLPRDQLNQKLRSRRVKIDLAPEPRESEEEIDQILTQAAQEALKDLTQMDYTSSFGSDAREFIPLGLAIYDDGRHLKALFGPKTPQTSAPPPPASGPDKDLSSG
ncbi:MAG: AAA family ATPase [Deltaproteobacteria bacterium]|jgi:hypothetical protein|nr:AAA family ATPase [Deltaproteobacteria bacterium]